MYRSPLNKFSFLIILSSIFFLCRFAYAQPKIFFEEVIFDAGEVEQGTEVEHVFSFVNQGLDELVIQKVSTS